MQADPGALTNQIIMSEAQEDPFPNMEQKLKVLFLVTNRYTMGFPKTQHISLKTQWNKDHSVGNTCSWWLNDLDTMLCLS